MKKLNQFIAQTLIAVALTSPGWSIADEPNDGGGQATEGNGSAVFPDVWDIIEQLLEAAQTGA